MSRMVHIWGVLCMILFGQWHAVSAANILQVAPDYQDLVREQPAPETVVKFERPLFVQPEQVHLSLGGSPSEMVVTWVTFDKTSHSIVEYGRQEFSLVAKGNMSKYVDEGSEHVVRYIHRVTLRGLKPGQKYMYHCGSSLGWSDLFFFTTIKSGNAWSPRFAVYGDLGNENPQSLGRLQAETQSGHFDCILHVGDFAYDMKDNNGSVGDAFMRQIEAIAAYVPYMVAVGNHESAANFSQYRHRFTMAGGDGEGIYYSFTIGPARIISLSTELYFYGTKQQVAWQYAWLEHQLQIANANRDKQPWLITMGHRPMYCSSDDDDDCLHVNSKVRLGLENLFYKYGVDLMIWAHEHNYQRLWPVFNTTVCNGSTEAPYTNPRAPVHIITGSAGCKERVDPFVKNPKPWSAFLNNDYGYTRMTVHNSTHIYMEQVSDDKAGAVIDKLWLIKTKHGAGLYNCH